MPSQLEFLKRHSPLKMKKEPDICNAEIVGPQDTPAYFDLTQIKGIAVFQFADCNIKVSNERGFTEKRKDQVVTTKLWAELFEGSMVNKRLTRTRS